MNFNLSSFKRWSGPFRMRPHRSHTVTSLQAACLPKVKGKKRVKEGQSHIKIMWNASLQTLSVNAIYCRFYPQLRSMLKTLMPLREVAYSRLGEGSYRFLTESRKGMGNLDKVKKRAAADLREDLTLFQISPDCLCLWKIFTFGS